MGKRAKRANARRKAQSGAHGKQKFYPRHDHAAIPIAASATPDTLALVPPNLAELLLIARPSAQHVPARRSRPRQAPAPPASDDSIIYIGPPAPADPADAAVKTEDAPAAAQALPLPESTEDAPTAEQALPLPESAEPLVVAAPGIADDVPAVAQALPLPESTKDAPIAEQALPPPQTTEDTLAAAQALPLPESAEPLVVAAPVSASAAPHTPLPRDRAVAKPQTDLWGAIQGWLRSARRLLRAGVTTKAPPTHALLAPRRSLAKDDRPPSRPGPARAPAPTPREQLELIQLRAENRRLREQLARLIPADAAAPMPAATQPVTSDS